MAIVGIKAPAEVARILSSLDVPGQREDSSQYHVTLLHLGDTVSIDVLAKAVVATHEVTQNATPLSLKVQSVSSFPRGEGGVPIICPVVSGELQVLRASLAKAYDAAQIEFSKKFPVFRPHLTLSYLKEGDPPQDYTFGPLEWSVYEIVLWGGDEGDERLSVTFPFSLPGKTALFRRLVEAQQRFTP